MKHYISIIFCLIFSVSVFADAERNWTIKGSNLKIVSPDGTEVLMEDFSYISTDKPDSLISRRDRNSMRTDSVVFDNRSDTEFDASSSNAIYSIIAYLILMLNTPAIIVAIALWVLFIILSICANRKRSLRPICLISGIIYCEYAICFIVFMIFYNSVVSSVALCICGMLAFISFVHDTLFLFSSSVEYMKALRKGYKKDELKTCEKRTNAALLRFVLSIILLIGVHLYLLMVTDNNFTGSIVAGLISGAMVGIMGKAIGNTGISLIDIISDNYFKVSIKDTSDELKEDNVGKIEV